MSDERFELELRRQLRQVDTPADLRERLLQIPDLAGETQVSVIKETVSSKKRERGWMSAAVAVAALIAVGLVVGWWYEGLQQAPGQPQVAASDRAILDSLQREIDTLAMELSELELSEETAKANPSIEQQVERFAAHSQDYLPALTFYSAETSALAGLKSPAIKEQLEFVVQQYAQSPFAERAKSLLLEF